jgi:uncharacterized membrane protein YgdD (TMEM256/DUF423 family)
MFIPIGAALGFLGVAAGAFAAHGLKSRLSPEMLAVFETGARYLMYHALAVVLTGVLAARRPGRALPAAGWSFVLGCALFSGSLFALALTGAKWLGAVTPFGGAAFLAGWLLLAVAARGRRRPLDDVSAPQ